MSFTYGFYNSVNHDRVYDANQFGQIFEGIIRDGVYMSIGQCFNVYASEGMEIHVGTGRAWFNGTWSSNDTLYPITLENSHPNLGRIDAVILEVNKNVEVRENSIKVIRGEYATNPVRPTLNTVEGVYQHPLAYINIPYGTSNITDSMIDSMIGREECPFVSGILEVATIDEIALQLESKFMEWFEHIQYVLSGDAAGKLAADITLLEQRVDNIHNDLLIEVPISAWSSNRVTMNGSDYYTAVLNVRNGLYDNHPIISIGATELDVLPAYSQLKAFSKIRYVLADVENKKLTLYAEGKPDVAFHIMVKGGK